MQSDVGSDMNLMGSSPQPTEATYIEIGNSLTVGTLPGPGEPNEGGYRRPLHDRIARAGWPWSAVGPYTDAYGLHHAGLNGRDTAGMLTNLPTYIADYDPAVVILYEGTVNCISPGYDGVTSAAELGTALNDIEAGWPNARVIVITPIPTVNDAFIGFAPNVVDYNSRIPAILDASPQHLDGRLFRVDAAAVISPADVAAGDGVHYLQPSHEALAAAIWPVLYAAMTQD